jgi:hypothetical protein
MKVGFGLPSEAHTLTNFVPGILYPNGEYESNDAEDEAVCRDNKRVRGDRPRGTWNLQFHGFPLILYSLMPRNRLSIRKAFSILQIAA